MKTGIYIIENTINNKKYIGSSINITKRWYQHKHLLNKNIHENSYLQNAWNKYGKDCFKFKIIEFTTDENLILREQYYIDYYNVCDENFGYNLAPIAGNTLGYKHTNKTKKKMSLLKKGKPSNRGSYIMSEETKKKISEKNKISQIGRRHSKETKKKMSDNRLGITLSSETRKKISNQKKGTTLSENTKKKISKKLMGNQHALGYKHTDKTKEILKNKIVTEETKNKISQSIKGKNRGINNGMCNTNIDEVIAIRNDYANNISISELQIKYNKKYMLIYKIVNRITWDWLDDSCFS